MSRPKVSEMEHCIELELQCKHKKTVNSSLMLQLDKFVTRTSLMRNEKITGQKKYEKMYK